MKVITKQEVIAKVAENYMEQYSTGGYKLSDSARFGLMLTHGQHYELLKKATTEEEVEEVLGNRAWTRLACSECNADVDAVVQVGQEPDYESYTAYLCPKCVRKAARLIKGL